MSTNQQLVSLSASVVSAPFFEEWWHLFSVVFDC